MRPVGYHRGFSNPVEQDALWDLAAEKDDRVRLLFIEKALERPEVAVRLGRCAEIAVHAAVGLDKERREGVLQMVRKALGQGNADHKVRVTCACLAAGLREDDETALGQAVQTALFAMPKATDWNAIYPLEDVVPALAARMRAEDAAAAAARTLDAMATTTHAYALEGLGQAVAALAARMRAQELVDLAKHPACVGHSRHLVLQELGRRMNHPFADLWELVDWLHDHEPGLDLSSPPQRPATLP